MSSLFVGFIDYRTYLSEIGQIQYVTLDQFGQSQVTSVTTVACRVYDGDIDRQLSEDKRTETISFQALVPVDTFVPIGSFLSQVVWPKTGLLILSRGRVTMHKPYVHWEYGPLIQQLELAYN